MKKFHNVCLAILFIGFFTACEKDFPNPPMPKADELPLDAISTFTLSAPVNNLSIDIDTDIKTPIVIEWASTKSSNNEVIKYTFLADEENGDFSTPLLEVTADNEGKSNKLTLTHSQIDEALVELGVAVAQTVKLKW
jgi:starch-binding outer membrane protein SusE/F